MSVRDRAAQLPGHLDEQNGGPETARLDGGDGTGRSAAHDKHVIVNHRPRLPSIRQVFQVQSVSLSPHSGCGTDDNTTQNGDNQDEE